MKKWQWVLLEDSIKTFFGMFVVFCIITVIAALFLKSWLGYENTVVILLALIFVSVFIAAFFTVAKYYFEIQKNQSD